MTNTSQIKEHMKVVGSDGQQVGTVDRVQGDQIILTKNDPSSGGQHHAISKNMVDTVEQNAVKLNVSADQAKQRWQTVSGSGALGQASGGGGSNQGGGQGSRGASR